MSSPADSAREGGCLCGQLRFRTVGSPRFMAVCHCRYCQKITGSAANTEVVFLNEHVQFSGDVHEYEYRSPAHQRIMRSHFCCVCGVTVGLSFERFPTLQAILTGTYDEPSWVPFDKHIFTETAMPWMSFAESMDLFTGHCLGPDGSLMAPRRPRSDLSK